MLLVLMDRATQGQRGESTGHSHQGIRMSAGLQEKFCDICGSQFDTSSDLDILC